MKLIITNYERGLEFESKSMTQLDAETYATNIIMGNYPYLKLESNIGNICYFNKNFLDKCVVEISL